MKSIRSAICWCAALSLLVAGCAQDAPNPTGKSHTTIEEVNAERSYQRAKEAVFWSQSMMGVALSLDAI